MTKNFQFGVMQRGVFEWEDDMVARFDELMEQARALEALGYDSLTTGSHFSTRPHRPIRWLAEDWEMGLTGRAVVRVRGE